MRMFCETWSQTTHFHVVVVCSVSHSSWNTTNLWRTMLFSFYFKSKSFVKLLLSLNVDRKYKKTFIVVVLCLCVILQLKYHKSWSRLNLLCFKFDSCVETASTLWNSVANIAFDFCIVLSVVYYRVDRDITSLQVTRIFWLRMRLNTKILLRNRFLKVSCKHKGTWG